MLFKKTNNFEITTFNKRVPLTRVKALNNKRISFSYQRYHDQKLIQEVKKKTGSNLVYLFKGKDNKLNKSINLTKIRLFKEKYFKAFLLLQEHKLRKKALFKSRLIRLAVAILLFITITFLMYLTQHKEVLVIFNNQEERVRTVQFSPEVFIKKYAKSKDVKDYQYGCNSNKFMSSGLVCTFDTKKTINLTINKKKKTYTTYTANLEDFIEEISAVNLKGQKNTKYISKVYVKNLDKVTLKEKNDFTLFVQETKTSNKTITLPYQTIYKENKSMKGGETKVLTKGVEGKVIKEYTIIYLDGKKTEEKSKVIKTITKKQDKVIEHGVTVVTAGSSVWDKLAQCESGGRWNVNSGNGYSGGLQFSAGTWRTAAGAVNVSAPYAFMASREDQIKAATWLQKRSGWGQWPACSSKLGLR
jgi:uncharacterized protein YabE (DUF348 family)